MNSIFVTRIVPGLKYTKTNKQETTQERMEVSVRGKANPKGKSMLELDTELYEAPDINQFAFSAAQSFCPISLLPDNVKT